MTALTQHRPRNVGWARAASLLYGDWGTSKAYVIGAAFLATQYASLPIIIAVCLFVVLTMAAGAAPAKRADACTWGASSVVVEEVNGQLVQSEPVTTGCIP